MGCKKCDNLGFVALKGDKGDIGATGPAGPIGSSGVISLTKAALLVLKNTSVLVKGQLYMITDWSAIEQLIVMAANINKLSESAHSNNFENDIISVDLSSANPVDWKITYRKDTIKQLSAYYDWRTVKFTRWQTGSNSTGLYTSTITTAFGLREFFTFGNHIDFSTPLTSFVPVADGNGGDNTNISLAEGSTNTIFGNNSFNNVIGKNADKNTLGNGTAYNLIGDYFRSNTIAEAVWNKIIDYFHDNTLGNLFWRNKIGVEFNNNTIGNNFSDNNVGNFFQINTIGNDFTHNVIGNDFFTNTIVSGNFRSNHIGHRFMSNIIGIGFFHNKIGNDFRSNFISSDFRHNDIGNDFISNSTSLLPLGNNFQRNVIEFGFTLNTGILANFQLNHIESQLASIDFSLATRVYGFYTTEIIKDEAAVYKLRYTNGANVLTYVLVTA